MSGWPVMEIFLTVSAALAVAMASGALGLSLWDRGARLASASRTVEQIIYDLRAGLDSDRLATANLRDQAHEYMDRGAEAWHKAHSARGGKATATKADDDPDPGWDWNAYRSHLERHGERNPAVERRLGWRTQ